MRTASPKRTPCEVLRLINDEDNTIRKLCAECEKLIKSLSVELARHNKYFLKEENKRYKPNAGWRTLLAERLEDSYLQEASHGKIGKVK